MLVPGAWNWVIGRTSWRKTFEGHFEGQVQVLWVRKGGKGIPAEAWQQVLGTLAWSRWGLEAAKSPQGAEQ